jgi:hypothetical protein
MNHNLYFQLTNKVIVVTFYIAILLSLAFEIFGQTKPLVKGNPPLTAVMIERFVSLMEWSLKVKVSKEKRSIVEKQIINYWQTGDEKNVKSILNILAFEQKLASADEAKKQEIQPHIKKQLLEPIEKESSDPLNAILLEIYKQSQNPETENPSVTNSDVSSIVGKWQVLHGNSMEEDHVPVFVFSIHQQTNFSRDFSHGTGFNCLRAVNRSR